MPKFHAALHLASQNYEWSTFVLERKHTLFKTYATHVTNRDVLERRVTLSMLNHQVNSLNLSDSHDFKTSVFLVPPTFSFDGAHLGLPGQVDIARMASRNMVRTAAMDYVVFSAPADAEDQVGLGLTVGHFYCHGEVYFSMVRPCAARSSSPYWHYSSNAVCVLPLDKILGAAIWTDTGDGIVALSPRRL